MLASDQFSKTDATIEATKMADGKINNGNTMEAPFSFVVISAE